MANQLRLGGFAALRGDLEKLPSECRNDAAMILRLRAEQSRAAVATTYPVITGELRAGVRVIERKARGIAALFTLVTSAPYAHIFEFGSVFTRPRPTFLPITGRDRRAAVRIVAAMVRDKGLKVTGDRD